MRPSAQKHKGGWRDRYQGVSGDHVVQGNSRGNFLQISDTRHGARLHALIMRLIILTGY
jgi:hypothetical protein